jgi:hypothetical protein
MERYGPLRASSSDHMHSSRPLLSEEDEPKKRKLDRKKKSPALADARNLIRHRQRFQSSSRQRFPHPPNGPPHPVVSATDARTRSPVLNTGRASSRPAREEARVTRRERNPANAPRWADLRKRKAPVGVRHAPGLPVEKLLAGSQPLILSKKMLHCCDVRRSSSMKR